MLFLLGYNLKIVVSDGGKKVGGGGRVYQRKIFNFWVVRETLPPFPLVGKTNIYMYIYIYPHTRVSSFPGLINVAQVTYILYIYIYVCVCVYMYICYILIHIYHIVCDYEITQAMQFVETSFYLALLHQHKFTKLY